MGEVTEKKDEKRQVSGKNTFMNKFLFSLSHFGVYVQAHILIYIQFFFISIMQILFHVEIYHFYNEEEALFCQVFRMEMEVIQRQMFIMTMN